VVVAAILHTGVGVILPFQAVRSRLNEGACFECFDANGGAGVGLGLGFVCSLSSTDEEASRNDDGSERLYLNYSHD
jgi:hypothetical protein